MAKSDYKLDQAVGFLMRRANQRHLSVFAEIIPELTPMQFAALAKLHEKGALSQNHLGRETAMDAATIKGVIERLTARGWVTTKDDPDDRRRLSVALTPDGRALTASLLDKAEAINSATLQPLSVREQETFVDLLRKLT